MLVKIKYPPVLAILAAALYALSTPFSKLLLAHVGATMLAALLYLGAGLGLLCIRLLRTGAARRTENQPLSKSDIPYIITMILLDIAAPVLLMAALRSADIVIVTDTERDYILSNDIISEMKRGVVVFDLTAGAGHSFPGMRCVDLGAALPGDDDPVEPTRTCYVNAGSAVPRTTAMAISNTIAAMLADIAACDGVTGAVKFNAGIAKAAYTFLGKPVNGEVARIAGLRSIDINLLLQLS